LYIAVGHPARLGLRARQTGFPRLSRLNKIHGPGDDSIIQTMAKTLNTIDN